ncbi:MAG: CheB methylesterase domain-containing protein [Clostridium sp.]
MAVDSYEVVVIGASTGGPKAIEKLLLELPSDLGVPVLIVQHMPKGFTKSFADRLNKCCSIEVLEASHGIRVEKNKVYIAPGGYHMEVSKGMKINLNDEPSLWGVKPAVDKLFMSVAEVCRGKIISVILTGMGKDGAQGIRTIKEIGGVTMSQDEESCVIYGMPKAAYETGCVDIVLPLDKIATKIKSLLNRA